MSKILNYKTSIMSINPLYHQTSEKLQVEQKCIQLAKQNPKQFGPLYEKYHEQIFRYIYQRVDTIEAAQDITSQVFFKAINKLNQYEFKGVPFGSWLYRIAKSELYQSFRDDKAKRTVNIESVHLYEMMDVFYEDATQFKLKHLISCIEKLKETEIQLIELRFFEKRSFKEIAEILEITENNAKVKCFRVLLKLKRIYLNHKPNEKLYHRPQSKKATLSRSA